MIMHTYSYSLFKGLPPGAKNVLQLTQARQVSCIVGWLAVSDNLL